jgi:hypothetical protein
MDVDPIEAFAAGEFAAVLRWNAALGVERHAADDGDPMPAAGEVLGEVAD